MTEGSNVHKHKANENRADCPFCSADGKTFIITHGEDAPDGQPGFCMKCENCGATGPKTFQILDAAVSWNFRNGFPVERGA